MEIQALTSAVPAALRTATPASTGGDFGKLLTDALGSLSQVERNTDSVIAGAATGNNVDVHDVMIAMQAESLAFQTATQVRNKLVEAYQDVFRMQM